MPETEESITMLRRYTMPVGDLFLRQWSQGAALQDIGATDQGLLALNAWVDGSKNLPGRELFFARQAVRRFLGLPDTAKLLARAIERRQHKRADMARERNAVRLAHTMREGRKQRRGAIQQAEFDAHNRERGLLA